MNRLKALQLRICDEMPDGVINLDDEGNVTINHNEEVRHVGNISFEGEDSVYTKTEDEQYVYKKYFGWSVLTKMFYYVDKVIYKGFFGEYSIDTKAVKELYRQRGSSVDTKVYIPLYQWEFKGYYESFNNLASKIGVDWMLLLNLSGLKPNTLIEEYFKEVNVLKTLGLFSVPKFGDYCEVLRSVHVHDVNGIMLGTRPSLVIKKTGVPFAMDEDNIDYGTQYSATKKLFDKYEKDVCSGLMLNKDYTFKSAMDSGLLILNEQPFMSITSDYIPFPEFTNNIIRAIKKINDVPILSLGVPVNYTNVYNSFDPNTPRFENDIEFKKFFFNTDCSL